MKYYLIAGEASGDLHGSNLMKGLLRSDPQAEFRFWGGDLMAAVGGREHLAKHYRDASFFGIGEIVRRLPTVLAQIRECKRDIAAYAPDVLVLIDYPGFNFRMAKFAHGCGIRVFTTFRPRCGRGRSIVWNESAGMWTSCSSSFLSRWSISPDGESMRYMRVIR